jgi:hypothetical protein
MNESSHGISFDSVLDLCPQRESVLVRHSAPPWCREIKLGDNFTRFKFDAIKWIKKRPRPEDRVWLFEISDPDVNSSFEKLDHLIDSRKTRVEKEKERIENERIEKLIRDRGLT